MKDAQVGEKVFKNFGNLCSKVYDGKQKETDVMTPVSLMYYLMKFILLPFTLFNEEILENWDNQNNEEYG